MNKCFFSLLFLFCLVACSEGPPQPSEIERAVIRYYDHINLCDGCPQYQVDEVLISHIDNSGSGQGYNVHCRVSGVEFPYNAQITLSEAAPPLLFEDTLQFTMKKTGGKWMPSLPQREK